MESLSNAVAKGATGGFYRRWPEISKGSDKDPIRGGGIRFQRRIQKKRSVWLRVGVGLRGVWPIDSGSNV